MKIYKFTTRGIQWSYHWFSFVLGSLRFLESNDEKVNILIPELLNTKDMDYCYESLEYFKDKFNFYFDTQLFNPNENEIIEYFGEKLLADDKISEEAYTYIRDKILNKYINNNLFMNECIFIKRNNQSNLAFNTHLPKRRNLVQEEELCTILTNKYNFKCINLEDYNLNDKIAIFQNAKIVVSTMGGALIFAIFANINTKIVELYCDPQITNGRNHFKNLCEDLKLNYERYSETVSFVNDHPLYIVDSSISLDVNSFLNYLEKMGIKNIDKDKV